MRRASNKDQKRILTAACDAGWTVKETNAGWMLLSPDGKGKVAMHTSSSDHRAIKNIKAMFRQAGLDMSDV